MAESNSETLRHKGGRGPIRLDVHPLMHGTTRLFKAQFVDSFCKASPTSGHPDNKTGNWITLKDGGPE